MRKFMMCEGANEQVIINILLKYNKLIIKRENLVGAEPYNVRKLKNVVSVIKAVNEEIELYRIGDTMNDNVSIPKVLNHILSNDRLYKYHTKPELEILLIINEGLWEKYKKVQSTMKPKIFAKNNIEYNGVKYNNSCDFYYNYYDSKERVEMLVQNLREYKRVKMHKKNELFLADLLK